MTVEATAALRSEGLLDLLDVELARSLAGMAPDEPSEVALAIALASRHVRRGHTCLPLDPATIRTGAPPEQTWPELPKATDWVDMLSASALTRDGPLVVDARARLYLRRYFEFERDIAEELAARAEWSNEGRLQVADEALERLMGSPKGPRHAAGARLLRHRVSVLCGGPGTGKTTTVAAIAALFAELHIAERSEPPKIMLLAPTGKAAARLGEAVSRAKAKLTTTTAVLQAIPADATTLQRALGLRRHGFSFRRGRAEPLDADLLVVDEASMVDLGLMRQLLISTHRKAHLLIVGDPDQLTSVEAGSVLKDLVRADAETWWSDRVTHLTTTYRYAASESLGRLVSVIREGNVEAVFARLSDDDQRVLMRDLTALHAELDEATARWKTILSAPTADAHFAARGRFVVLSPFRRGPFGTRALGRSLERRLGDAAPPVRPVIVEANDHDLGVYNGDLGMSFERDGVSFVAFPQDDGTFAEVASVRLPEYTPAFALSVHKAQGSEFDDVLIVLPDADNPLLTRELLYTAVSRARRGVRVVGPASVVAAAVERRARRFSGLVDRIAEREPRI